MQLYKYQQSAGTIVSQSPAKSCQVQVASGREGLRSSSVARRNERAAGIRRVKKNDASHDRKHVAGKQNCLFLLPEMRRIQYINSQIVSIPVRARDDHSLTHQALRDTVENKI